MEIPHPGQRWMSDSEPELGLGMILDADPSSVRLFFPAVGEMRTYSLEHAPLKRVWFQVGDEIEDQKGTRMRVTAVTEEAGLLTYVSEGKRLVETDLADRLGHQGPLERFLQGKMDSREQFDLRVAIRQRQHTVARHPGRGLMGGRISWIPHQIAIAREVSRRGLPRVLLADEVGLGKTIEACLILHHALVTGRVQRVLILVPEALVHQWFVELLRRFQLHFAIYDSERMTGKGDDNPFLDEQCVLAATDDLTGSDERVRLATEAGWDMLIVDEAHHLQWSPDEAGPAYAAVETLSQAVSRLLLLTATPEQMGLESHFAHLRLLDPDRYSDLASFMEEQEAYTRTAEQAATLREQGDETGLRQLLDEHGPGRVMFRNTRERIQGFPRRHVEPQVIQEGDKVSWLADFLTAHPVSKVLVMMQMPEQVLAVDAALRELGDVPRVLFHENQSVVERDRQAAWFAEEEGAQLMLASDIGGEGRNFQFVQHLVLFDLPREPERIEQRIGRLDRIGQRYDIHIHLPVMAGTPEADLLRWLHEGLDVFSRPLQCGHRVYELFRDRLDTIDDALITETREAVTRLEAAQRSGRNRLLTWKHELEEADGAEMEALQESDEDPELLPFAETLWTAFGLELEYLQAADYLLKPGPFDDGTLTVRSEGLRLTPDRRRALEREDMDLLTWDHPLIREGMDAGARSVTGTCNCVTAKDITQPLLQLLYTVEAVAPGALEVDRFLPPTPFLLTLDVRGNVYKEPVILTGEGQAGEWLSNAAVRSEWLPSRLEDGERKARGFCRVVCERAAAEADQVLRAEWKRLESLRAGNDHVRLSEIAYAKEQHRAVLEAIGEVRPRLEALRLIVGQSAI